MLTSSDFTLEEQEYFKWFAEKFRDVSYDKAMSPELSQELYDKAVAGMDKFGWSKSDVYKMFFTVGNVNKQRTEQLQLSLIKAPELATTTVACECYYDLGCPTWDCDSDNGCDSKNDTFDCGIFGDTDCDGTCQ